MARFGVCLCILACPMLMLGLCVLHPCKGRPTQVIINTLSMLVIGSSDCCCQAGIACLHSLEKYWTQVHGVIAARHLHCTTAFSRLTQHNLGQWQLTGSFLACAGFQTHPSLQHWARAFRAFGWSTLSDGPQTFLLYAFSHHACLHMHFSHSHACVGHAFMQGLSLCSVHISLHIQGLSP